MLKINSKLGGTNQVLSFQSLPEILKRPVLIMGADVTHPAPDQERFETDVEYTFLL